MASTWRVLRPNRYRCSDYYYRGRNNQCWQLERRSTGISDDNQDQQQQPETKVIKSMVETPDSRPPKEADSIYTIRKSENPTETRTLSDDA